jgi:hypothetical protein
VPQSYDNKMPGILTDIPGRRQTDEQMATVPPADVRASSASFSHAEMTMLDSLCDYANNMSLQDEIAADLINELVARGASQGDVTNWAPSSVQYLPFARYTGGGTIAVCKGCGQQSSRKHKCHSFSQQHWSKLLRTGGGWAAAFKAFDRRGWWLDLSPEQAAKARKLKIGVAKAATGAHRPIGTRKTDETVRKLATPQNNTLSESEPVTYISGQGVEPIAVRVDRGVLAGGDSYLPDYADHGPPPHSFGRAAFDEPRRSRGAALPPVNGQKSNKARQKAYRRARIEEERVEQLEQDKNINPTQISVVDDDPRRIFQLVDRRRLTTVTTAAALSVTATAQQILPQFDYSTIQHGIDSPSLG